LICKTASATFPVPGSPFVLIIAAPSSILLSASANDLAPFTNGEPGTGNVAEAVLHIKKVNDELRTIKSIYDSGDKQELVKMAREFKVSFELVEETAKIGRMPVVNFAAGGIATPADAAYLMSLGCDGIFVGSGIFKAEDAIERARAVVLATTFWEDAGAVKEAQKMINEKQSILGLDVKDLELRMQDRGSSS